MNEEEIWKDVEGYEGLYQVSNMGRVRSLDRVVEYSNGWSPRLVKGRVLKPGENNYGYLFVSLWQDGSVTEKYVHRLVGMAFLDNPDPEKYDQINHIDEVKTNNRADNLEWCDAKYNINYGECIKKARPKISAAKRKSPVMQISPTTGEVLAIYPSTKEVERKTRYAATNISHACNGGYYREGKWIKANQAYGYIWRYMWETEEETERAAQ